MPEQDTAEAAQQESPTAEQMADALAVDDAPPDLNEAAKRAAIGELDYEGPPPDRQRIVPVPADRDSYLAGIEAGIRAVLRLVPAGDPTAFAMEQLWIHQRWMAAVVAKSSQDLASLVASVEEYRQALPAPDSLAMRIGGWRGRRSAERGQPWVAQPGDRDAT